MTDAEPVDDAEAVRRQRNRWYAATAVVVVLFLLSSALLLAYRWGQGNSEAAAQTTTTTAAPTTTAPTGTVSPPPTGPSPTPNQSTSSTQSPSSTTTAPPKTVEEAKIRADVDNISKFVEQARGLTYKEQPHVEVFDEQSFKDRIAADIEKDRPAYEQEGNLLKALGLIPADLDYIATLKKLKSEEVVGFYDPRSKELVVRGGTEIGPRERVTMAHELTHALQDQWFTLDRAEQYKDTKTEVPFTFKNIAEGDANRIAHLYVRTLPIPDQRQFDKDQSMVGNDDDQNGIPAAMRSALEDPYVYGEDFVSYVMQNGGQQELDRLFNDPPPTSEQIMHLDKYAVHEPAIDVPAPPTEPGAKTLDDGPSGEYQTDQILRSANSRTVADQAAAGWGGDHTVMYSVDGKLCIRTDYAMDTPADLDELQKGFEEWAKKDEQGRKVEKPQADRVRVTTCIPQPPPPAGGDQGRSRNV